MGSFSITPEYMINCDSGSIKMPSMHYHASYELYYLRTGNRDYFIEDKIFPVAAGDFVLIPPGKLHRTGGEYGERILIGFTTDFLSTVYTTEVIDRLVACFSNWILTPSASQQKTCTDLLKRLLETKDKITSALLLGMLLLELDSYTKHTFDENPINPFVSYINKNFADITSLEDIASHFYISKHHLCRIFKSAMKITVIDYLNQIRIKNACQMLSFTKKNISCIAEDCGFHSTAYFSRVFKEIIGTSPKEYRKDKQLPNAEKVQPR